MSIEAVLMPNGQPLPSLPQFDLPPLPQITDKELRDMATTHTSVYCVRRDGRDLEMTNKILDYEKLEHVGDALLGSSIVVLLHELYPNLRQGPASRLKDDLISNETLAQLADRYGISDQLKASPSAYYVTKLQVKTRGSLFESWIAGIYYSFLKNGPPEEDLKGEPDLIGHSPEASESPERKPENVKTVLAPKKALNTSYQPKADEGSRAEDSETSSDSDEEESESAEDSQASFILPAIFRYPALTPAQPQAAVLSKQSTEEVNSKCNPSEARDSQLDIHKPPFKPLSEPEPKPEGKPTQQPEPTSRTYGDAFDYLCAWLHPLFTPIAQFAMKYRVDEHTRLNTATAQLKQDTEDRLADGAKGALDLYVKQTFGVNPVYEAVRVEGVKGAWKATCTVTHPDGTVWQGEGIRRTKKLGYNVSAYLVAKQLQIF